MGQDAFDDIVVVIDAELVGHRQQQRVGLRDRLVGAQLLDQPVGFGSIGAAEDRCC
ncbi:hypothetical protein AB5I41_12400 [Sphingomonas sp. MMS24-JH45]